MQTTDDQLIFEKYQQINEISNVAGTGQSYSMWNRLKSEFGQSKLGQHLGLFKGAQGKVDTERKANELTRRLQEFAGQTGQDVKSLMRDPASMANWLNQQVPQVVGDSRLAKSFNGSSYSNQMAGRSPHDFFTYVINDTVKNLSQMPVEEPTQQVDANVDSVLSQLNALNSDPNVPNEKKGAVINAYNALNKTFKGTTARATKASTKTPSKTSTASAAAAPISAPTSTMTKPVTASGPTVVKTAAPKPTATPISTAPAASPKPVATPAAIKEPSETLGTPTIPAKSETTPKMSSKKKASVTTTAPEKAAAVATPSATTTPETSSDINAIPKGRELNDPSTVATAKSELRKIFPSTASFKSADREDEITNVLKALGSVAGGAKDPVPHIKQYINKDSESLNKSIKNLSKIVGIDPEKLSAYFTSTPAVAAESVKRKGKMIYEKISFIDCRTF